MKTRFFAGAIGDSEVFQHARWNDYLCWALIFLGACLRIVQWTHNRSLWLDESYLAINIVDRDFGALHTPLEFNQSAPWLFLIATKAAVSIWGPGEMVMRVIPLLASIASLWVFWRLTKECLEGWLVPLSLGIFVFSFRHVYYAQELKQYSLEILLATLAVWQAAMMFRRQQSPHRYFTILIVTGSIGIFAMHAMPFVLAGIGSVALWQRWKGMLCVAWTHLALGIGIWLVLFAINYLILIRPNYANPVMKNYWAFAYPGMPWTIGELRNWAALVGEYFWYLGYSGGLKVVMAALLAGGIGHTILTRNWTLLACALIGAFYWLAALAGKAPFSGRLVLFLFPYFVLFVCAGLSFVLRRKHWFIRLVAAGLVLVGTVRALPKVLRPIENENLREPILQLAKLRAPSEPVYVMFWAVPAFRYYRQTSHLSNLHTGDVVLNQQERLFVRAQKKGVPPSVAPDFAQIVRELSEFGQHEAFWVLIAHMPRREEELLHEIRGTLGLAPEFVFRTNASSLYRFKTADFLLRSRPE